MSMIESEPSNAEASPGPVRIRVTGNPVPQGSKRAIVRGGKAVLIEQLEKTLKPWRRLVTLEARRQYAGREKLVGPLVVRMVFSMPRPKSVRRMYPSVAPDLDKLTRAVGDALTDAGVWGDDGQVVHWDVFKLYAGGPSLYLPGVVAVVDDSPSPGVTIDIWPLDEPKTIKAPAAYVPRQVRSVRNRPTANNVESLRTPRERPTGDL